MTGGPELEQTEIEWNEAKLNSYIENLVEQSLTLDYKAAEALALTDKKKREITKDVSAMARGLRSIMIKPILKTLRKVIWRS